MDGPASVRLLSGKAEVFGCQIKGNPTLVREGKRLPFYIQETAVFDVSLGANARAQEVEGTTIPQSWSKTVEAALAVEKRPATVLVLGTADSGKSSLCTFIVNKLVPTGLVAVLDGDLGQSDIGPSATVSYALAPRPVPELYELHLENARFVGVTSPILAFAKTLGALTDLSAQIQVKQVSFVVVNTDGWVNGDIAMRYKTALCQALKPDIIVGVQVQNELEPLVGALNTSVTLVEPSSALCPRTPEKRKALREMTYQRYLKNAKLQCYPRSHVEVESKNVVPKDLGSKKGVLLGLYGRGDKYLGIGVLREVDNERKVFKVQTAVKAKPLRLVIGKILLNEKLQEIVQP